MDVSTNVNIVETQLSTEELQLADKRSQVKIGLSYNCLRNTQTLYLNSAGSIRRPFWPDVYFGKWVFPTVTPVKLDHAVKEK